MVVTGGGDDRAFLWDMTTGDLLFELSGHKDSVSAVGFSVDGKLVATGAYDGAVNVWDTQSGKLLHLLEGPTDGIEWLQWHPRGNVVLAGSRDKTAWMWTSNGMCMNVFSGHAEAVSCGTFSEDGHNSSIQLC